VGRADRSIPSAPAGRDGEAARDRAAVAPSGHALELAGHQLLLHGDDVLLDGVDVKLSPAPYAVLQALVVNPGHVVSRRDLLAMPAVRHGRLRARGRDGRRPAARRARHPDRADGGEARLPAGGRRMMRARARLVTVAHGTRVTAGNAIAADLTAQASALLGVSATTSYVELCAPLVDDVLAASAAPTVVVPLLLSTGFHVKVDIPAAVHGSRGPAALTRPLGPDPVLADVQKRRLLGAGARPGGPVVLVAAGSNDPDAVPDLVLAQRHLAAVWGGPVLIATVSGAVRSGRTVTVTVGPDVTPPHCHTRAECHGDSLAPGAQWTRAVAIAATPSPRPVSPRPSVVVAESETGAPTTSASSRLGLGARAPMRGPVADHLDRDVADLEAGGAHASYGLGEQGGAGGAGPLRLGRAEVAAEVAEPGRREQRVAGGVAATSASEWPSRPAARRASGGRRASSGRPRRSGGRRCRCRCGESVHGKIMPEATMGA
jgi:hypothetical protein